MEPDSLEMDWKEVAVLLNSANQMLTEKLHEQEEECARLQAKTIKNEELNVSPNKGLN